MIIYDISGLQNPGGSSPRATDLKTGNAGPRLHWHLWEKSGFPALPRERYLLAINKGHDGEI